MKQQKAHAAAGVDIDLGGWLDMKLLQFRFANSWLPLILFP